MKMRLLAAAAMLAVLLAAPARAADVDPLWPEKSQQVMRLNIKQVLESDLIKKFALAQIKQAMEGKNAKQTLEDIGIDPLKDIESLSAGMWNEDPNNPKATQGVMILRGKFDPKKIFDSFQKLVQKDGDKFSIVQDGDSKMMKITVDQLPDPLYGTMADDNTILLGTDKKLVQAATKAADTKAKSAIKSELADLVKAMDAKASFYMCGIASGKVGDIPPNPLFDDVEKLKKQIESMDSSSMTLRVTGDISMEGILHMKTTAAADDFGETIKELLDKARVFLPIIAMQAPQAKSIVDDLKKNLKSSVDGKNIKVSLKVTGDAIGKAVGTDE